MNLFYHNFGRAPLLVVLSLDAAQSNPVPCPSVGEDPTELFGKLCVYIFIIYSTLVV